MRAEKRFFALIPTFALTQAALGLALQLTGGMAGRVLSYSVVVLACLFCTMFATRSPAYVFTQAAFVFTVCADYFLVLSDPQQQLPAMLFFSGTQLCYFARLYAEDPQQNRRHIHLIIRVGLSALALTLTLLVLGQKADAVALVSMFYYANLLLNIVFAFAQNTHRSLFAWGLVLFALCDTVVGLACLDPYITISQTSLLYRIIHPGFDPAWMFYVPSQTLLAISLWQEKK